MRLVLVLKALLLLVLLPGLNDGWQRHALIVVGLVLAAWRSMHTPSIA